MHQCFLWLTCRRSSSGRYRRPHWFDRQSRARGPGPAGGGCPYSSRCPSWPVVPLKRCSSGAGWRPMNCRASRRSCPSCPWPSSRGPYGQPGLDMGRRGPTAISRAPSRATCCMLCGLESVRLELCHWDRCHLQGDGEQRNAPDLPNHPSAATVVARAATARENLILAVLSQGIWFEWGVSVCCGCCGIEGEGCCKCRSGRSVGQWGEVMSEVKQASKFVYVKKARQLLHFLGITLTRLWRKHGSTSATQMEGTRTNNGWDGMNGEGVTRLDRTRDEAPSSCTNGVVLRKTNNYLHQDSPSASLYVSKKKCTSPFLPMSDWFQLLRYGGR